MSNNPDQLTCDAANRIKARLGLPTIAETSLQSAALDLLLALECVETVFSCWDTTSLPEKDHIIVEMRSRNQEAIKKAYGGSDFRVSGRDPKG
jgi:hypothetical protein